MKRILSVVLTLLIIASIPFATIPTVSADETVDNYKKKISDLQEKEAEYQEKLDKTRDKIKDKKAYSETLVSQIDVLNKQISTLQSEISNLSASISEKQRLVDEAQAKIETQMTALKKRIRTIYMAGDTNDLEIILGAKDFSDFLDKSQLVETLAEYDENLINGIQEELDVISAEKAELEIERGELEDSKQTLDTKQGKLQTLLDENEELLASLYDDENDAEAMIANAQAQEDEIQSKLNAYYASQQAQNNNNNNNNSGGSSGGGYINPSSSGFAWPVPGFYYVISTFNEDRGYSHKGIDITGGGIMGATCVAAYGGTVVTANNSCSHNWGKSGSCGCGGGYGNYVLIDHGNGKTTLYAHLSSTTVYTGASVSKGQTIGYIGSTGWSTGAHLHYECRYNGAIYDPMSEY